MNQIPINIAVEDLLSEAVAKKVLRNSGRNFLIGATYSRGGFGYLKRTARGWNQAAKGLPFFLLTDLDDAPCAKLLMSTWLNAPLHPNFIFRVAVREVESWLLADHASISKFLHIPQLHVPLLPDEERDAKKTLIHLASKSPASQVRYRVVPRPGTTAKQGRDYNSCLIEFVESIWDPAAAAENSPSLSRCFHSLKIFQPTWSE